MKLVKFLNAIENCQDRDLRIDDLTDVIEDVDISEDEAEIIVARLDTLVGTTTNADEQESFFYFLAALYFKSRARALIEEIILKKMDNVNVAALIHCIEIISESNLPSREVLLRKFLGHSNPAVRNLVNRRIS